MTGHYISVPTNREERAAQSQAKLADAGTLGLTTLSTGPLVTRPPIEPPIWLWNGHAVLAANVAGYGKAAPDGQLGRLAAWSPLSHR